MTALFLHCATKESLYFFCSSFFCFGDYLREDIGSQESLECDSELLRGNVAGSVSVDRHERSSVGLLWILLLVLVVPVHELGEGFEIEGLGWDTDCGLELIVVKCLLFF